MEFFKYSDSPEVFDSTGKRYSSWNELVKAGGAGKIKTIQRQVLPSNFVGPLAPGQTRAAPAPNIVVAKPASLPNITVAKAKPTQNIVPPEKPNPRDLFIMNDGNVMNRQQLQTEIDRQPLGPQKESLWQSIKAPFDITDPTAFAGSVSEAVKSVARPLAKAGVTIYNAAGATSKAVVNRDIPGANAEISKSRDLPGLGPTAPLKELPGANVHGKEFWKQTGAAVADAAGTGAEIASNFLIPAGVAATAKVGNQTLKQIITTIAKNQSLPSAIYGAGQSLQAGDSVQDTFKNVAINTLFGTVVGLGLEGRQLSKLAINEIKTIQTKFVDDMVAKGYPRAQAEAWSKEGGFLGLFDSPKVGAAKERVTMLQDKLEDELYKAKPNKNVINRTKSAIRDAEIKRDKYIREDGQRGFIKNPFAKEEQPLPELTKPPKQRKFIESVKKAPNIAPEVKAQVDSPSAPITNKGTFEAAKNLVDTDYNKALETFHSGKVSAEVTAVGEELMAKAQREGRWEVAADFANQTAQKLEAAGQMVQAAAVLKKLSPEGVLIYAQKIIKEANKKRLPIITKERVLTPDTAKKLGDLAEEAKKATDPKIKDELQNEIVGTLQALKYMGLGKKVATTQTIAQLLNPKTIGVRNPLGNELFFRLERANKYLASGIDWAKSTLTGGPRTVTFRTGGQSGYWKGLLEGAKAGWKGELPAGLAGQFDFQSGLVFQSKWNPLRYMEKTLKATLQGFDYAAFNRGSNQTVGELAWLLEKNKKTLATGARGPRSRAAIQKWVTEVEKNVDQIATEYGKYVTYQDDNWLSKGLGKVKTGLNFGQDFGIGDIVVKYTKTTGALILRALEYSPAGFLKSAAELAKPILTKGPLNQRELTLSLSRAITGSIGITGLGYYLADKGIITGKVEEDQDLRALKEQTGVRKYQVNVSALTRWVKSGFKDSEAEMKPGDNLMSYDWAQPIALSLSLGANANQNVKAGTSQTQGIVGTAAASAEGAFESVTEQPVLQGVTRLFQGYGVGNTITNTAQQLPASFTPTLGSQINQKMDNTVRSTYDPNPIKEAYNRSIAKIPFASKSLPASVDVFGDDKQRFQDGSNTWFNVFLNPGFRAKYEENPEIKMVMDIYAQSGEKKQAPRVVPTSQSITTFKDRETGERKSENIKITPQQQQDMQRAIGRLTKDMFSTLASDPDFTSAPVGFQADYLAKVLEDINTAAKMVVLGHRPSTATNNAKGFIGQLNPNFEY